MKCRARMINGSPVTFDLVEYQVEVDDHPYLRNECNGEGFFVRSSTYAYWGGEAYRKSRIKIALERAGVDTETVEYIESYVQHRADSRMPSDLRPHWALMFPPMLKTEPSMPIPGAITYLSTNPAMPPRTDDDIIAAMVDACAVHIPDPGPVMQNIYAALRRHLRDRKFKPVREDLSYLEDGPSAYPNEPIKSWSEAQSKQPIGVSVAMEFECPTEIDTYDQRMAKAAKWARNRIGVEKIVGGGIWALDLLAGLAEDFVKTPAPSTEPTDSMIQSGWAALIDSPLYGQPRKTIQMIWAAMEKARTR